LRFQPADAVAVRDGSARVGTASHGRILGGKVSLQFAEILGALLPLGGGLRRMAGPTPISALNGKPYC
jgi:hypothetical protein